MLVVTGHRSAIIQALLPLLPDDESVGQYPAHELPLSADRYVLCAGVLVGKRIIEQTPEEVATTFHVNFELVVRACEHIFANNGRARVCVIGSESGFKGSFDQGYAGAKAALHRYVETRRLSAPGQQLFAVSPGIIADAGMTLRRTDLLNLENRRQASVKKRFIRAEEVAEVVKFGLYDASHFLTNCVVRLNGGEI